MYHVEFYDDTLPGFTPVAYINLVTKSTLNLPVYVSQGGPHKQGPRHYTRRVQDSGMYDLVLTTGGEGLLRFLGKTYSLIPGTVFFMDANTEYFYQTASAGRWDYEYLHLYGSLLGTFYQILFQDGYKVFETDLSKTQGMLQEIYRLVPDSRLTSQLAVSNLLCGFFHEIAQQGAKNAGEEPSGGMELAVNYICSHFREHDICISQLAQRFMLSEAYFIRKFKKHTGTSPYSYLLHLRLQEAQRLLIQTNDTIYAISAACGFGSEIAFIKAFDRAFHTTPSTFRKLNISHSHIKLSF